MPRTAVTYSLYGDSVYVVKPAPRRKDGRAGDHAAGAAGRQAAEPPR